MQKFLSMCDSGSPKEMTEYQDLSIPFENELHPYRKFVEMQKLHGPLVRSGERQWIALGHATINNILRDTRFLAMNPVDDAVERAVTSRNRYMQFFMRPALRVLLNRHKFLSMVKLWLVMNNPPSHTRLRKISYAAFTPASIRKLRPLIEKVTNDLLDELEGKEDADIIKDFALPLPIAMIAAIIGIPNEGSEKFNTWSQDVLKGFDQNVEDYDTVKQAIKSQEEVKEFLSDIIKERENNPRDDVLSIMLQARKSDDPDLYMTDDEIIANVILLLIAGHETTVNLLGNSMYTLLTHQDQYNRIKHYHTLLENAIEEALRYDTPISIIVRIVGEDLEMDGMQLRKGDRITVMLYAGNYDNSVFDNPEEFDITRKNAKKHVSFGQGIHFCLGAPLARAEAEIALSEIMKRFPDMQLTDKLPRRANSFGFNGFEELQVKL